MKAYDRSTQHMKAYDRSTQHMKAYDRSTQHMKAYDRSTQGRNHLQPTRYRQERIVGDPQAGVQRQCDDDDLQDLEEQLRPTEEEDAFDEVRLVEHDGDETLVLKPLQGGVVHFNLEVSPIGTICGGIHPIIGGGFPITAFYWDLFVGRS